MEEDDGRERGSRAAPEVGGVCLLVVEALDRAGVGADHGHLGGGVGGAPVEQGPVQGPLLLLLLLLHAHREILRRRRHGRRRPGGGGRGRRESAPAEANRGEMRAEVVVMFSSQVSQVETHR